MSKKIKLVDQPYGLTYDILYEVRRVMRRLRRVEKWIVTQHKAERRRRKESNEWPESARIRDQERK